MPAAILAYSAAHDLELWSQPSAEAQCAALADDIAYDAHDIDDGLRADLFTLGDITGVPLVGDIVREVQARYPSLEPARRVHEVGRRLITRMIEDVIAESETRLAALGAAQRRRNPPCAAGGGGVFAGDGRGRQRHQGISCIRACTATPA